MDDASPRYWLIPMTWVWATAHGLWPLGVALGLACCFGLVLDRRVGRRDLLRLLALPALSLLAAALTPVGPRLLLAQGAVLARSPLIGEWGPTSFRSLPAIAVAVMIVVTLVIWLRAAPVTWTRVVLLVFASGCAAYSTRLVPVAGILAAGLLAQALEGILPTGRAPGMTRREWAGLALCAGVCLAALGLAVPHTAAVAAGVPEGQVASRLAQLPAGTTVLDTDYLGGWLEWRYPRLNPVIDGMFDAYPVRHIQRSRRAVALQPGWQHFVRGSGARVAVLEEKSPLAAALHAQLGWSRVATSNGWSLLGAPGR